MTGELGPEVEQKSLLKKRCFRFKKSTTENLTKTLTETSNPKELHNFTQDIPLLQTVPASVEEIAKAIDVCIENDAENISVNLIEDNFPDIEDEFPEGDGWKLPIEKYIKNYKKLLVRIKETFVNNPQIIDRYGSVLESIIEDGQKKKEIRPDQIAILLEFIFKYKEECYFFTQDDVINLCIEQSDNKLLNTIISKN